jgi:hypothetical protein
VLHTSQRTTTTGHSAIPWCKCQFRENRYYENHTFLQRVKEILPLVYTFFIRFRQNLGTALQCSGCYRPLCTVTRATVTVNNTPLNSANYVTEFSNCNLVITKMGHVYRAIRPKPLNIIRIKISFRSVKAEHMKTSKNSWVIIRLSFGKSLK